MYDRPETSVPTPVLAWDAITRPCGSVTERAEQMHRRVGRRRDAARCAIQLAAAAANLRESIGDQPSPLQQTIVNDWFVPLQQSLGQEDIRSAWEAGRAMSLQQALELALAATQTPPTQPDEPADGSRRQ